MTVREVRRIAALARLRLEPEEAERMAPDMSAILTHMAVLGDADLDSAGPSGPQEGGEAARCGSGDAGGANSVPGKRNAEPDPLVRPLSRLAPDWRGGFFVVPRLPGVAGADDEPEGP